MLYVLIVVTLVHHGSVVEMQEFASKEHCEAASKIVLDGEHKRSWARVHAYCTPK